MDLVHTQTTEFITRIHLHADKTVKDELNRLYVEEATVPSCKKGCDFCCRHYIITNFAEIKTLASYIKRTFCSHQIEKLRIRTIQWLQWDHDRRFREHSKKELNRYCPLLVNRNCGAYQARPLICRRFFVNSDPSACMSERRLGAMKKETTVMTSVISATHSFESRIKAYIERLGIDCQKSTVLLPHGLAAELNWKIKPDDTQEIEEKQNR